MKNTYLIFFNPDDTSSDLTIKCTREELNDVLIKEELMESDEHYSEFAWIIFENGIRIQN